MACKLDIPLHGTSLNIVRRCGSPLSAVLQSKFGCKATIVRVDFERNPSGAQQRRPTIQEKRFTTTLPVGVQVSVWKADLTDFKADAVVNAANKRLQHFGGLAQALSLAGGPQIQRECDDFIEKYGALKTGHTLILGAGSLPFKKIIHAVGPNLFGNPSRSELLEAERLLEKVIKSILDEVKESRLQSVAIPAISSGLFNYPLPECAKTIVSSVRRYYEYASPSQHLPREILLVNNDERTVAEMEQACRQILAGGKGSGGAKTSAAPVQLGNVRLTLVKGKIEEQQILYKLVYECLRMAAAKKHNSISFPAIGTGALGFNKKESAQIMSQTVAEFARIFQKKMDVYFVIFPSYNATFKAFEEQMTSLKQKAFLPSFAQATEHRHDLHGGSSRAPTPQISLTSHSDEAMHEAKRWLTDLLFRSSGAVVICNNFIQHFGEREHLQLSRLLKTGLSIEEVLESGRAVLIISGESVEDVVVAGLQVEAMLCSIQKEFATKEECTMLNALTNKMSFERKLVDNRSTEFTKRCLGFKKHRLHILKMDKVENSTLEMFFKLKRNQLHCTTPPRKMIQRIPACFCEMVSHIGFHAEYAPPDEPAFGEGIYFAANVNTALEVWKVQKEKNEEYLYFVEAEVLTGKTAPGEAGLILPPPVGTDPLVMYDSVSGGPDVSVIFSGYQALPIYIVTCKMF